MTRQFSGLYFYSANFLSNWGKSIQVFSDFFIQLTWKNNVMELMFSNAVGKLPEGHFCDRFHELLEKVISKTSFSLNFRSSAILLH